jgi:hypothetical protein
MQFLKSPELFYYATQLLQIAKTRQKIWSLDGISQVFPCKLLQIYITSVSGCLHFTFKTCRIVAGASMIRQFHEFLEFYFWRFFAIWFSCVLSYATADHPLLK